MMLPLQCQMARAAFNWCAQDLAKAADLVSLSRTALNAAT